MANNENSLADALLLASVEDMSPGSKEAIFQKGRNSLLQKARHLIIDMQEKRSEDGTRLLFNHDRSGQPTVNFQELRTMRWMNQMHSKATLTTRMIPTMAILTSSPHQTEMKIASRLHRACGDQDSKGSLG